jgi:glycosyltransferase involved in cell wall biosynthesis
MVVHAYYPLAEPRVQREAAAARDAGYCVTVLSLRGDGELRSEMIAGIRVRRLGLGHKRGAGLGRILLEYLAFASFATWWLGGRSLRRPFDVVHFHNPPDFLCFAGVVPRLGGSRLILDIHDLSSHMLGVRVSGVVGSAVSRLLVWIERLACRFVDEVITVHAPYRRELVDHGIAASKISVVMNSVDEAVLERARRTRPLVQRGHDFRLAYHGTLTWWYGADLIVDALALLRGTGVAADVVILGAGDAVPALRRRVAETQLEQHVYLSDGYVPIEVALATVATADCGVIPNRPSDINRFALSSKLFEYVALEIPVVVARLETLAAHFGPAEVTFFEPGDAGALAEALRWVQEHPDEAHAKAGRARERAHEYSWSRGREQLARLYHRLTGEGDQAGASSFSLPADSCGRH